MIIKKKIEYRSSKNINLANANYIILVTCTFTCHFLIFNFRVQYLPRFLKMKKGVMILDGSRCDRYGMILCIPLVWLFAQLLTSSGVYDHKSHTTQTSCRTDRTGLITNTPWSVLLFEMNLIFFRV